MSERSIHAHNILAILWDFDKTLSPRYMQTPLFRAFGIDERAFWREVNALPEYYRRAGIHVHAETCYLGHLLTYVKAGRMPGLTNARLRELGAEIDVFPGLPGLFDRLAGVLDTPEYAEAGLKLEHYVVSTGLAEMIRGSAIARYLSGVWASEFIEEPFPPEGNPEGRPVPGAISQIATFVDNTTKTRAIFEINKGVNVIPTITVNDMIPEEDRRVPARNMIYVADGPSDIPSFSVVRKHGGLAYAVYDPQSPKQFAQVDQLLRTGRVDAYGPADYTPGSQTDMWLILQVRSMAERVVRERHALLQRRVAPSPTHVVE